ncbi:MAG TPA: DUF2161 family putative PD-(D/E)XK-type phosphodiesterase [Symbiobacteriaceae bacterium]|jgi:hypothetical protein
MGTRRETELYEPMKRFLEAQGYEVRGEVQRCDLAAVRGDELLVVELKAAFNLALVLQGIKRQQMTDLVYLAVEAPKSTRSAPRLAESQQLCRRLGLGLAIIHFRERREPWVEVVCDPGPFVPHRMTKKRSALLKEFAHRSADHNTGGSVRRPLVTAYREEALRIAAYLRGCDSGKLPDVKAATGSRRAATILRDDVYGWFERVDRGVYRLSPKGAEALAVYADVVAAAAVPER